jgi:hypothetical protein
MPVDQALINDEVSLSANPTAGVSIVIIEDGPGEILLEVEKPPGTWNQVKNGEGVFVTLTPDLSLNYRFRARGVLESRNVYLGP